MAELTTQQIEEAVMRGLRSGALDELVDARATAMFYREFPAAIAEKFEKTLSINCADPEMREAARKDMEYIRVRRIYAESDRGVSEQETLRALVKAVDTGAFHLSRIVIMLLVLGLIALASIGVAHKGWIGEVFH